MTAEELKVVYDKLVARGMPDLGIYYQDDGSWYLYPIRMNNTQHAEDLITMHAFRWFISTAGNEVSWGCKSSQAYLGDDPTREFGYNAPTILEAILKATEGIAND